MAPVLMYCIGATKAGTSWLYEQLVAHPECHLRTIKELHYFDSLEKDRVDREITQLAGMRAQMVARLDRVSPDRRPQLERRIQDRADWMVALRQGGAKAYLDYLRDGAGDARLIGDVTPAYALLPVDRLRQMAGLVPQTRFVYLLRDPVSRLWSHVRMMATRRAAPDPATPDRAARILKRTIDGKETEIAVRGDYIDALRRLDAALDPKRVLVMFYEELFQGDAFARICAFLGISARPANVAARVYEGVPMPMTAAQRDRARDYLAPQYDYVKDRMGHLPDAWLRNMQGVMGR